ncbi:ATP-binding protein [Paraglaciecola aquimarina]|uniref:histidine kinase n=1 Tax=Paraglaciecola algarum TaxID=3050085 RepID=A0ABS9DBI8_9ALTE|nr:ATP-binding protein [Paraglaciecola sp. G1-23]MCF2949387.1 ATP-binding protein [Paraglaciecola sp. G1-23]
MRINVGGKLWLAFFCTLTLTVLTMYLLLHNSLKRGFLDYTSVQAIQRLDVMQGALLNIYRSEGSFSELVQDPKRWLDVKSIIFSDSHRSVSPPNESQQQVQLTQNYYREFVTSISLFDADKNLLMGIIKPEKTISWIPLVDNNAVVAFIGFVKPEVVERESDRRFMAQQLTFFGIISLVVLFISIGVATILTRRISRPIIALSKHTEALASGDYQQRIKINSHDEIAQLGDNFNKLAQTLEANEQSRANWIADISHEMRTPVAVLKAQIEAMQDGIRPLDKNGLSLLAQKVEGLNTLVDDLFELTLSDIGALSYHKQRLSIDELIQSCVEQFQTQAQESNLSLVTQLPKTLPINLHGDGKRLEQLLTNLIENAIRYTDSGGRIEVELITRFEQVIILVRDSAPSVDISQREKIFERLHRLENSRNRATGGAGLGLAICKNIVAAHQGTICAEDSPLGGICIRVTLPQKAQ